MNGEVRAANGGAVRVGEGGKLIQVKESEGKGGGVVKNGDSPRIGRGEPVIVKQTKKSNALRRDPMIKPKENIHICQVKLKLYYSYTFNSYKYDIFQKRPYI